MNPTITFKRATAADATTLANLRIRFALELSGDQPEAAIEALRNQMTEYFLKATSDNSCISILAECDNAIVGIGSVHVREVPGNFRNPTGKWGYIMNMYTLPDYRKLGICNHILTHLQGEAQKGGVSAFELHATTIGEPQYLKAGFQLHHEPTLRKFISE